MYKVIQFQDGSEGLAEESDIVKVEMSKDDSFATTEIYSEQKPKLEKGKYSFEGEKTIVDLTKDKPHNMPKDPRGSNKEVL